MSMEVLNQIRAAEEEAERLRQEASAQAREMIKGAGEAIAQENRQSHSFIHSSAQRVLEDARALAEREIASAQEKWLDARETTRQEAIARLDAAAERIFERIVEHGDR